MKTKEVRSYGHCGIDVHLNSMDQYAINHLVERFEAYLHALETAKAQGTPEPVEPEEEIDMCLVFLRKLALEPNYLPDVFTPKEDEDDEKEC